MSIANDKRTQRVNEHEVNATNARILAYAQQDITSTSVPAVEDPEPAETDYEEPEGEYDEYTDPNGNLAEQ